MKMILEGDVKELPLSPNEFVRHMRDGTTLIVFGAEWVPVTIHQRPSGLTHQIAVEMRLVKWVVR